MASRFRILADLIRSPEADARQTADRPKTAAQRERERAELRRDMAEGAAMAREQAARQARREPDRETDHDNWCLYWAHRITDAGRRARGLKPLFSDDREPSNEYPDDYHGPSKDPDDGDDSPIDDKKDKKSKKKAKPKPVDEGDSDENTNPDERETEAQYREHCRVTAAKIVAAGRRARGLDP